MDSVGYTRVLPGPLSCVLQEPMPEYKTKEDNNISSEYLVALKLHPGNFLSSYYVLCNS